MAVPQQAVYAHLFDYTRNRSLAIDPNIFHKNSTQVQYELAPVLRKMAVEHLHSAQTPTAKTFRGDHLLVKGEEYQEYLRKQAQNGAWGTDIEAIALGEALEVNIIVTSIYKNRTDATWCLHLQDPNLPTIHLYNHGNQHWTNSRNTRTIGDGNCLYNAIAQGLQELVVPKTQSTVLTANSLFQKGTLDKEILENQMRIKSAIDAGLKNQQTPAEKAVAYANEEIRIQRLPIAEQQQIAEDYALALIIAREEMLQNSSPGIDTSADITDRQFKF